MSEECWALHTDQWAVLAGARQNDEENNGRQRNLIGGAPANVKGGF